MDKEKLLLKRLKAYRERPDLVKPFDTDDLTELLLLVMEKVAKLEDKRNR